MSTNYQQTLVTVCSVNNRDKDFPLEPKGLNRSSLLSQAVGLTLTGPLGVGTRVLSADGLGSKFTINIGSVHHWNVIAEFLDQSEICFDVH